MCTASALNVVTSMPFLPEILAAYWSFSGWLNLTSAYRGNIGQSNTDLVNIVKFIHPEKLQYAARISDTNGIDVTMFSARFGDQVITLFISEI